MKGPSIQRYPCEKFTDFLEKYLSRWVSTLLWRFVRNVPRLTLSGF